MTPSLVLLAMAAAGLVAFATSALAGLGAVLSDRVLGLRAPAARARVLLGLALLPGLVTTAVLAATLAPLFGWITDHCLIAHDPHLHPHLCGHHQGVLPSLPMLVLASIFGARWLASTTRVLALTGWALRAEYALIRRAQGAGSNGVHVLPLEAPQAFVLGVFRPSVFVTRGLLTPQHHDYLATALAHERAHVQRADPLRRLIASVAFGFHLPGIARAIERRLARAHEMAADEDAARAVGSRIRVASALVHLARAGKRLPQAALAFAGSDVELRVHSLLDRKPRPEGPGSLTLLTTTASALLAIAWDADGVHHGIERMLGLFSG